MISQSYVNLTVSVVVNCGPVIEGQSCMYYPINLTDTKKAT